MDLQFFIYETLTQLILAVKAAQPVVKEEGARVAPDVDSQRTPGGNPISNVEFDVAVTVAEGAEKKGGLGLTIAAFAVGGTAQASSTNSTINRIKFTIPIAWPLD